MLILTECVLRPVLLTLQLTMTQEFVMRINLKSQKKTPVKRKEDFVFSDSTGLG